MSKTIDEQIDIAFRAGFDHRVGSHSDDWGGDSDEPCHCARKQAIKRIIAQQVREARIDELGKLMPPVADMIPEWKWPCYVCGFDRELLRKHIEDRIAALKGDK